MSIKKLHAANWRVLHLSLGLLAVFFLVASTGCQKEIAPAVVNPAGVYKLVRVDGHDLPCSLTHQGMAPTIKSGIFTINTNGTCSSLINFSMPGHGDLSREVKASYTQNGAELTMQWEGAGMNQGRINGNQFFMTNERMLFFYQK